MSVGIYQRGSIFVARHHCKGNPLLHSHGNTEQFFIVDSYMLVKNSKGGMYCFVSMIAFYHAKAPKCHVLVRYLSYIPNGFILVFHSLTSLTGL